MPEIRKRYYYSLVFTDINRIDVEEEVRDVYMPLAKNSMGKHQQSFPSLVDVMEPSVNFFTSNDEKSSMATFYGYERKVDGPVDEKDEEGLNLWLTVLELLISFVRTMSKSHEFELYTYGMAYGDEEFGWFSYPNNEPISAEEVYKIFPREHITI